MKTGWIATVVLLLLTGCAWAGDITVSDVWARASVGHGGSGAVFMTLVNGGKQSDKLVSASTPVAKMAHLHNHVEEQGVMTMRMVDSITLDAGQKIALKPGGYHLMLMDLVAPLKEGDSFPVTLIFEKAGAITVTASIGSVAAMGQHPTGDIGY
jgi:periplasmic copper chaperone A